MLEKAEVPNAAPEQFGLRFPAVLVALKDSIHARIRARRMGWNAGGQYITLVLGALPPEFHDSISFAGVPTSLFERHIQGIVPRMPHLELHTAQGARVPWLASQTDLLAEDWIIEYDVVKTGSL